MVDSYLQLRSIEFTGPTKKAHLSFQSGVNVICGASDTGKSFLAEAVDFMLGGSSLKEIPERVDYGKIGLSIGTTEGEEWRIERATSGGDFSALDLNAADSQPIKLKQNHAHDRVDNLSGFLLDKIGLLGKRILKMRRKRNNDQLKLPEFSSPHNRQGGRDSTVRLAILGRPIYTENGRTRDSEAAPHRRR